MPPHVHYAAVGAERIAYQVLGSGPDLLYVQGTEAQLDWLWELPQQAREHDDLASFSRLILFDRRGTGLSDRLARVLTPDERVDDTRAVLDAVGSQRAYLYGRSEGGTLAMLFAALRPERTAGLITWGCRPRWVNGPDYPWGRSEAELEESCQRLLAEGPELIDPNLPKWQRWLGRSGSDPSVIAWMNQLRRAALSPNDRVRVWRMNGLLDIRPLLPSIRVPTLVLAREDDPVAPLDLVHDMASQIPRARVIVFPGHGHQYFDIWPEMCAAMKEFVTGETVVPSVNRLLVTLVFADLVSSTALAAGIGDSAWRLLLERYYGVARRELAAFSGIEVDTAGDGFFARFDGPARAIWYAKGLRRSATGLGLNVRIGIHTGEVEPAGPSLRGIAVTIGARIGARAGPGEILVSGTVRDLLYGAGFTFDEGGIADLKGIPEPQRIYALAG